MSFFLKSTFFHIYVRARELTADGLLWLYAVEPTQLVVTGEAATMAPPQEGHDWQLYGTFPAAMLDGFELWERQNGAFRPLPEPQVIPDRGYFLREGR